MKFSVRHMPDKAYSFEVVESLGYDCQVIGEMFKVHVCCTHKESAEYLASQLNDHGALYLPGNLTMVSRSASAQADLALLEWWSEHPEYIVGHAPSGQWSAFDKQGHTCYGVTLIECLRTMQVMHVSLYG